MIINNPNMRPAFCVLQNINPLYCSVAAIRMNNCFATTLK